MGMRVLRPSKLRPHTDAEKGAAHGGNESCKEQFIETIIVDGLDLLPVACDALENANKSFKYMYLLRTRVTAAIVAIAGLIVHDEGMNEAEIVLQRTV
jgi:hypothetical protein